jgi:hypothetical protein
MAVIGATEMQPVNFLEQYAKGLEIGTARRALERQEVERIKAADQQAAINEMYRAAMQPGGAVDMNALYTMMAQRGMGGAIPGMQTQQADVAFKTAQAAKQQQEANTAFWAQSRDQLATIPDNDQAAYQAWATNVVQRAPWATQFLPATLNAESKRQLLMTADAALPKGTTTEVGGVIVTTDPYTGKKIGEVDYSAKEQEARRAGAASTKIQNFLPASETAQVEFIKEFRETYKQLKTSPTDVANLRRAAELAKTEARKYMGTGGQAFLSAAKFLKNRLGVDVDAKAIANAEEARTVLFQNVLNNLRKLDAQPSQQQQFIMQEALGNLDTDPDALAQVVQVYEDVIRGRVEQHNREFAEMKANPNLASAFPYSLEIKLPERAAAPPPPAGTPGAGGQIVDVKTVDDARKLAPGTRFRTPDGRIKVR